MAGDESKVDEGECDSFAMSDSAGTGERKFAREVEFLKGKS